MSGDGFQFQLLHAVLSLDAQLAVELHVKLDAETVAGFYGFDQRKRVRRSARRNQTDQTDRDHHQAPMRSCSVPPANRTDASATLDEAGETILATRRRVNPDRGTGVPLDFGFLECGGSTPLWMFGCFAVTKAKHPKRRRAAALQNPEEHPRGTQRILRLNLV